jgi:hypothetical protein
MSCRRRPTDASNNQREEPPYFDAGAFVGKPTAFFPAGL